MLRTTRPLPVQRFAVRMSNRSIKSKLSNSRTAERSEQQPRDVARVLSTRLPQNKSCTCARSDH